MDSAISKRHSGKNTKTYYQLPRNYFGTRIGITKEEQMKIRELVKPAWRKYMDTCTEYINLHRGTLNEVDHLRARTLINIFSIAWSEIIPVYDEISKMILIERSARPQLDVSCIDWAFK
ncbi:MAG: hypothetical protein GY861_28785 [bacterium]|nr:hypothetical protein [bacterium]